MKLTFAVLALLCLSTAVNASSNAADFKKLPLAGLFGAQAAKALAEANLTVADLMPTMPNMADINLTFAHMPKFQMPVVNVTGFGPLSWHNTSDLLVPLVPLVGLKAGIKHLPLLGLLSLLNHTGSADVNFTMPSLPSLNVSNVAVPLHALLALPKALPLLPMLHAINMSSAVQVSLPHPHLPSINISEVAVPLGFLLKHKSLLALVANATASLPVVTMSSANISAPSLLVPFKALVGLKVMGPLALLGKLNGVAGNMTDLALSALGGLSFNKSISAVPFGGLASLSKSVNISDLPLGALLALGHKGVLAGAAGLMGNITAGPSVDVNLHHGSVGMKNIAFNVTHPTLGLKNLALALNLTQPQLALKLAALNLSLPVPSLGLGSHAVNVSVPLLDLGASMSNVTINVPVPSVTMPSFDLNGSADGNHTVSFTKPGLSLGQANITLPLLKPELALKLAQLGFNVPTPEIGLKRAQFGAALPVPDVQLAQKAVNLTVPLPSVGLGQFGVNLTVPDIQLPRLEVNVSGMPHLGLDGLKSATLLAWLKDAGFYAINKTISLDGNGTVFDLAHHGH